MCYTVSGSERHIEGSVTIPAGQSSAKSTVYQLPTKPTNVYVGNWWLEITLNPMKDLL